VRGRIVPIRGFLSGRAFEPEAISTMALAFNAVCDQLGLKTDDAVTKLVAEKIIELAQRGVQDADLLQTMTLNELGRD
jgi:hypothetical protein